jgi:hypothetical protein
VKGPRSSDSFSAAEEALLEFLAQEGGAGALDLEAFCADRPALASEVRRLHSELADIDRLVAAAPLPGPAPPLSSGKGTRYEIRGELARGGMGVVLQVWDAHLRRELAM